MKILLTSDTYQCQICGVNNSIATLEMELINRGHDVKILMLSDNHKSKIIKNRYLVGSFSFKLIDFRQSFKFNDNLVEDIISWNPDVVHIKQNGFRVRLVKRLPRNVNALI